MSVLSAFVTQLARFLEDLSITFPESRELKMGIEAIEHARKINPRLILDMFVIYIYSDMRESINNKDIVSFRQKIELKLQTKNNEILSSIGVFQRQWDTLSHTNKESIWKYLKVLCILCEKAGALSSGV